ncbi:MAG: hypothetical protein AB7F23_02260 [Phycisphaerae bacterium]|jgi:hypothetical protein
MKLFHKLDKQRRKQIQKIAATLFITTLIWVWADLSNDLVFEGKSVTVRISSDCPPDRWVSLQGASSLTLYVDLKGPSARIDELKRDNSPLEVYFLPPDITGQTESFRYPIEGLVQESPRVRQLGLTVLQCKPAAIDVTVRKLVKKQLRVVCIDENSNTLSNAVAEPDMVEMFVPENWSGVELTCTAQLTAEQRSAALAGGVSVKPYIEIEAGRKAYAVPVNISIKARQVELEIFPINGPRIGLLSNEQIARDYRVEIIARNEALTTIQVKASKEAYQAYRAAKYQMLVQIYTEDLPSGTDKQTGPIEREASYYFPPEFRNTGLISAVDTGVKPIVTFRLIAAD